MIRGHSWARLTLGAQDLSPEIVLRLETDQLSTKAKMVPFVAICGLGMAVMLAFEFNRDLRSPWVAASLLSITFSYALMSLASYDWLKNIGQQTKPIKRLKIQFVTVSCCTSVSWAAVLITLMKVATPVQQELLFGLAIGLISTSVFTGPLFYSLSLWFPISIGCFISLLVGMRPLDFGILFGWAGYVILTFFTMFYLQKKMTERAVTAVRLEESNEIVSLLLRDFQENSSDWLWEADDQLVLRQASPRLAEVLGQPANTLKDFQLLPLLRSATQDVQLDAEAVLAEKPVDGLLACIKKRASFRDINLPIIIKDERRWWSLSGKPIFSKTGHFIGYRGVGADITMEQRSREHITYLAKFDSLTNLANRNEFDEVLHHAANRSGWSPFALLYLDLDDFKTINDTYGHAVGDAVLSVVAERIRGCLREGDIAGRLGGDEFAIFVNSGDAAEACRVANRIIERIARPFKLDELVLELGISIGIALAPLHGATPSVLSRNADLALYRAKLEGRGDWRLYNADEDGGFHDSRVLQMDLRHAVAGSEFFLLFQPLIDIRTGQVTGLEALLRWMHPTRGLVMPSAFIPLAEKSGLIGPIGKWVIKEACIRASLLPRSICVAINLSPAQLRDEGLIEAMDQALNETGIFPSQIEFEITEAVNLTTCEQTLKILHWMQARGIRITIDDFGTGYSSLTLLRRFKFDKIKIDQSFIRDFSDITPSKMIVKSIIDLGHDMGMIVTAEGVETIPQVNMLRALGCDEAQGYLFAQPLSSDQLDQFMARRHLPAVMASGTF
jgi:diguanylate cyclase (GGDEF)-like protein